MTIIKAVIVDDAFIKNSELSTYVENIPLG